MFYSILDKNRLAILSLLKPLKNRFYLAGGTGLALQLGHRDSADFDFFIEDHFDVEILYRELADIFQKNKIVKTLEAKDSLNIVINDEIRLSFLRYPYGLLRPFIEEESIKIASVEDIACMKLSAIISRASNKDYIDLYFIAKHIPLQALVKNMAEKLPDLDQNLVLKSLVYFDDITDEKIMFKPGFAVSFDEIKKFFVEQIKNFV